MRNDVRDEAEDNMRDAVRDKVRNDTSKQLVTETYLCRGLRLSKMGQGSICTHEFENKDVVHQGMSIERSDMVLVMTNARCA